LINTDHKRFYPYSNSGAIRERISRAEYPYRLYSSEDLFIENTSLKTQGIKKNCHLKPVKISKLGNQTVKANVTQGKYIHPHCKDFNSTILSFHKFKPFLL
tara:strand:- start:104 stop:406 length:303 start_codon:yes stop_codon:yes gene_type:complete